MQLLLIKHPAIMLLLLIVPLQNDVQLHLQGTLELALLKLAPELLKLLLLLLKLIIQQRILGQQIFQLGTKFQQLLPAGLDFPLQLPIALLLGHQITLQQ
jgi:hypothetical protein